MSHATFIKALQLAENFGELITLGGGEPTVHPHFFAFLDKSMEFFLQGRIDMPPLVITNGKLPSKARKLLDYVEDEKPVRVELSLDEFHDPIRPDIEAEFKRHARNKNWASDGRGASTRTVHEIRPVGRAAEPARGIQLNKLGLECCCEDMLVDPFGNVFSCGCKTHLLGNVFEDWDFLRDFDRELAHTGGGLPVREEARLTAEYSEAA